MIRVIASGPTVPGRFGKTRWHSRFIERYQYGAASSAFQSFTRRSNQSTEPVAARRDVLLVIGDNAAAVEAAATRRAALAWSHRIVWQRQGEAAELDASIVSNVARRADVDDVCSRRR